MSHLVGPSPLLPSGLAPPQTVGGIDAVLQAMEKKRKLSVLDKTKMARFACTHPCPPHTLF